MKKPIWFVIAIGCIGYFLSLINSPILVALISWAFFLSGLFFIGYIWMMRRRVKKIKDEQGRQKNIQTHQNHITIFTFLVLLGVVAIVIALQKHGGERLFSDLYLIHLMFVCGSVFFFLLARFVFTGIRNPTSHHKFVYSFIALYTIAFFTGSVLLNNRFQIFG